MLLSFTIAQVTNIDYIYNIQMSSNSTNLINVFNTLAFNCKIYIRGIYLTILYCFVQDYPYFPYKKHSMVAVFVNLDDSSPENGGLCVYPGSHKLGPLEDASENPYYHYLDPKKYPLEKATPLTLKRGQVRTTNDYQFHHSVYINYKLSIWILILTKWDSRCKIS